jgi:hypothetical protein
MIQIQEQNKKTIKVKNKFKTRTNKKSKQLSRAAVRWFSPGTPVFSTNKTERHNITENC